jgi:biotin carboxyl carrier protein
MELAEEKEEVQEEENGVKPVEREPDKKFTLTYDGKPYEVQVFENGSQEPLKLSLEIAIGKKTYPIEVDLPEALPVEEIRPPAKPEAPAPVGKPEPPSITPVKTPISSAKQLTAPMPGKILTIYVDEGDNVNAGETVMILEAMKMENEIRAPGKGKVSKIHVKEGDSVATSDLLIEFG